MSFMPGTNLSYQSMHLTSLTRFALCKTRFEPIQVVAVPCHQLASIGTVVRLECVENCHRDKKNQQGVRLLPLLCMKMEICALIIPESTLLLYSYVFVVALYCTRGMNERVQLQKESQEPFVFVSVCNGKFRLELVLICEVRGVSRCVALCLLVNVQKHEFQSTSGRCARILDSFCGQAVTSARVSPMWERCELV